MRRVLVIIFLFSIIFPDSFAQSLTISQNGRFFKENEKPFFWLGDTAWLLLKKCTRQETINYLETRKKQGFNVVQVMLLHDLKDAKNSFGDYAIQGTDVSKPIVTNGNDFAKSDEYDYWDHVEWVIDEAAKRKMYVALVPVWGSNVKADLVSEAKAKSYAEFLTNCFRNKPNIIWFKRWRFTWRRSSERLEHHR